MLKLEPKTHLEQVLKECKQKLADAINDILDDDYDHVVNDASMALDWINNALDEGDEE